MGKEGGKTEDCGTHKDRLAVAREGQKETRKGETLGTAREKEEIVWGGIMSS